MSTFPQPGTWHTYKTQVVTIFHKTSLIFKHLHLHVLYTFVQGGLFMIDTVKELRNGGKGVGSSLANARKRIKEEETKEMSKARGLALTAAS